MQHDRVAQQRKLQQRRKTGAAEVGKTAVLAHAGGDEASSTGEGHVAQKAGAAAKTSMLAGVLGEAGRSSTQERWAGQPGACGRAGGVDGTSERSTSTHRGAGVGARWRQQRQRGRSGWD